MADVIVVPRLDEIEKYPRRDEVRRLLLDRSQPPNRTAKGTAPYETGAGSASIRADALLGAGGWEVRSSWDRDHYYMYFHERGTKYLDARPFLVPAWEGAGVR